jgi:hypothetical protein
MSLFSGIKFDRKEFVYTLMESGAHSGWTYEELAKMTDEELRQVWIKDLNNEYSAFAD